jgi:glucose-6-phosphate-specific signal transduction histidine kinase
MTRFHVNRISFIFPLVLSVLAFALVMANISAGVRPSADENMSAHIFQLLIVAEVPFIAVFLASSYRRTHQWGTLFAVQIVCIGMACSPVWLAGY